MSECIVDANDRILTAGSISYTYDNNGNTLTESGSTPKTFSYNAQNELTSVTQGTGSATFEYDANGFRTFKTTGGITTQFITDNNRDYSQVLAEVENGTTKAQYTYGNDLISQNRNGNSSYYLYDALGSTRALSDASGNITDKYNYTAFGKDLNHVGTTANSYKFAGEQYDSALDNYYLRARLYNQNIGRFTQQDSWNGNSQDPITLHKYLYANADGVNGRDPSGYNNLAEQMTVVEDVGINAALTIPRIAQVGVAGAVAANDALWATAAARSPWTLIPLILATLPRTLDDPERSNNKRRFGVPIIVFGGDFPDHSQHILDAQMGDGSNGRSVPFALNKGTKAPKGWYNRANVTECNATARIAYGAGKACDEYPFATTSQGGPENYQLGGVSLRWVDATESSDTGRFIARFYGTANLSSDGSSPASRFIALGIPFMPRSFYIDKSGKFYPR